MTVRYCADCRHAKPPHTHSARLDCAHPLVVGEQPYALSDPAKPGTPCSDERRRNGMFFVPCGIKGKLWEAKP